MGKPKGRKIKRKQKAEQTSKPQDDDSLADQQMGDGFDVDKVLDDQLTKNKIVTEDISINFKQTSKVTKKKDKRKQRKDKLLEKVKSSGSLTDKSKKAKERSQVVIVGDIQPLMDALPQVSTSATSVATKQKANLKQKNWNDKKWKTKRKEELNDINLFKKVLQLPDYQKDPLSAISNHVEYIVKGELV